MNWKGKEREKLRLKAYTLILIFLKLIHHTKKIINILIRNILKELFLKEINN